MDNKRIEGLIKLFLHDGLPPSIQVIEVPWRGAFREYHLPAPIVPSYNFISDPPPEIEMPKQYVVYFERYQFKDDELFIICWAGFCDELQTLILTFPRATFI